MKIATWNINGIKARHPNLIEWLKQESPDIACLQEIKSVDENFPREEIESLGYNLETHGQKSFNGVALLSKLPFDEVKRGLPLLSENDDVDEQARFIEGVFSIKGGAIRVASLYLPNGILAGDYNVIPMPEDCHNPKAWEGDALYRPESRTAFRRLLNLGLTEAIRSTTQTEKTYTFWDYQAGAWPKNNGIRIDHLLMSPEAAKLLKAADIDKHVRDWEKPSDHVPVWVDIAA